MEQDTRENGMKILIKEMVEDTKYGLMVHYMKGIGRMIRQMEEVD